MYHYDLPYFNLDLGDTTTATASNTKGMLSWVEDLSGEEHTSYDARGRTEYTVKRIPDPQFLSSPPLSVPLVSYKTAFTYDSLDRVTRLVYPDNDEISHVYGDRNQLRKITGGPSGFIISNITYQASEQQRQIQYGNGVITTYDYDPRLRLKNLLTVSPTLGPKSELIDFAYEFDGVSNIRQISDNRPLTAVPAGDSRRNTQLFHYDDLYRITRAQYSFAAPGSIVDNGVINYRYDRIGNMLSQTSTILDQEKGLPTVNLGQMDSGGVSGRYNRSGRSSGEQPGPHALTRISDPQFPSLKRLCDYDANGNMLNVDGTTNTWDFKDRLVAMENIEMRAAYNYDYTDRRVVKRVWQKSFGGQPTAVQYPDKYFEVREHDAPTKYVWNGITRLARVTGSLSSNQRVQRLRLWQGWNLCSMAVSSLKGPVWQDPIDAVFIWESSRNGWTYVKLECPWLANTISWVHASRPANAPIRGAYEETHMYGTNTSGEFIPSAGLEAWIYPGTTEEQTRLNSLWHYDPTIQQWLYLEPRSGRPIENVSYRMIVGPGTAVFAAPSKDLSFSTEGSGVSYFHQDHLGSSVIITGTNGLIGSTSCYHPYGRFRRSEAGLYYRATYGFGQKERDQESCLNYFEARFLFSNIGRFLTRARPKSAFFIRGIRTPPLINKRG